jgi:hypothetical protein
MFWYEILRAKSRARSRHVAPSITWILDFFEFGTFCKQALQLCSHSVFVSVFACCAPCCVSDVTVQVGRYQRQEPEVQLVLITRLTIHCTMTFLMN